MTDMEKAERPVYKKRSLKSAAALFTAGVVAGAVIAGSIGVSANNRLKKQISEYGDENSLLKETIHEFMIDEQERVTVTSDKVWDRLEAIGELATYMYEYGDTKKVTDTLQGFWGGDVPLTTNEVIFVYSGVIKVGIEIDKLDITVDQDAKRVTIKMPEPKVLDNYINLDSMECVGKNNLFNPIDVEKMPGLLSGYAGEELTEAQEKGLFDMALENAEDIIEKLLAVYPEYTVEFK